MGSSLSPALAFAAGAFTILSPCVLPLVPVVLGCSARRNRYGPVALAAGLVVAFAAVGFIVAAFGAALGIDSLAVRQAGSVVLCLVGIVLLAPRLQDQLAMVGTPLVAWATERQAHLDRYGLWGQAAIGALLGIVWSPCVGPTLGAATALAASGENLGEAAVVMVAFGLGIAAVLLVLAFAARSVVNRWRGTLMAAGGGGKKLLGGILVVIGVMILTGLDRRLEATILDFQPDWVIEWSSKF